MFHGHLISRTVRVGLCAVAVFMYTAPARGDTPPGGGKTGEGKAGDSKNGRKDNRTCLSAYESAQQREHAGRLVEANQLFLQCASATCGSSLRKECATKNTDLSSRLPSVVLLATDSAGEPLVDVQVRMDGQLLTSHLDGRALPVDAGKHQFSFSADGKVFASQDLTIANGEHNRQISVSRKSGKQSPNDPVVTSGN